MLIAISVLLIAVFLGAGATPARSFLSARFGRALRERFPSLELAGEARLDFALRLVAGPVIAPDPRGGRPPLFSANRIVLKPSLLALLGGRFELAGVTVDGIHIEADSLLGDRFVQLTKTLATREPTTQQPAASHPKPLPPVEFSNAFVRFRDDKAQSSLFEIGPVYGRVQLTRDGENSVTFISLHLPGSGKGAVQIRRHGQSTALALRLTHLVARSLPEALWEHLPVKMSDAGVLDLAIAAPHLATLGSGKAKFLLSFHNFAFEWRRLGSSAGPFDLRLRGIAHWDLEAETMKLEESYLEFGGQPRAAVALALALTDWEDPRLELSLAAQSLDWEAFIGALPHGWAPPPEAAALGGTLSGSMLIKGPLNRPAELHVDGNLDASALRALSGRAGVVDLAQPFTWQAPLPDGRWREVLIGPDNPLYMPIASLPRYLVRAVTTCEDAAFFTHHGFDLREIQDALGQTGTKRVRGASTITQQIAKNLYLSPERTLERKGREALATIGLEVSLPKSRLLEIYLNVAEWGPGIYGVGEAARHWFGKDARTLTVKEAAFLATIIPNPARYEMYRRRGALTQEWEERVR
ncbi:MAG TPA: biosynthetic peptidoglycan transglycosylase, partial [Anaeromyxobacteraceae bacterium]|nr:biosynthetic peptidoglycan transglycosylase [Anaeromyxobacteraceae bacterium]